MSQGENDLSNFITTIQSIDDNALQKIFYLFPQKISENGLSCEFFFLQCTKDELRQTDFIKFIISKIILYVLKRKDYSLVGLTPVEQGAVMFDIVKKAKSKFIKKSGTTGEAGELILFLILESRGIVQLLNKMNLKFSAEMPYQGLDAIHIEINNGVAFHYGQSKMYNRLTNAIEDAVSDIEEFDEDKEEFELDLVSSYIDNSKFDPYTEQIVNLLLPYEDKSNLSKVNDVFIGYDWKFLQTNYQKPATETLCDYLRNEYAKEHSDLFSIIKKEIQKKQLDTSRRATSFYLLPLKDVGEFRARFLEELQK